MDYDDGFLHGVDAWHGCRDTITNHEDYSPSYMDGFRDGYRDAGAEYKMRTGKSWTME